MVVGLEILHAVAIPKSMENSLHLAIIAKRTCLIYLVGDAAAPGIQCGGFVPKLPDKGSFFESPRLLPSIVLVKFEPGQPDYAVCKAMRVCAA